MASCKPPFTNPTVGPGSACAFNEGVRWIAHIVSQELKRCDQGHTLYSACESVCPFKIDLARRSVCPFKILFKILTRDKILTFFRSGAPRFPEVVYEVVYTGICQFFLELIIHIDTPVNRFMMSLWLAATNT